MPQDPVGLDAAGSVGFDEGAGGWYVSVRFHESALQCVEN